MFKSRIKLISSSFICLFVLSGVSFADDVQNLLHFYVRKFTPEKALLIIQDKPDETGMFKPFLWGGWSGGFGGGTFIILLGHTA